MTSSIPAISFNDVIRRRSDLVSADLQGEIALMSVTSGKYYCLNPTATFIWQLIEQRRQVAEICSIVQREFEVELIQCESAVLKHIAELLNENLAEVVDGPMA